MKIIKNILPLLIFTSCISISLPKRTVAEKNQVVDTEGIDTISSPYNFDNKVYRTNRTFVYEVNQNDIKRNYNFILELKVIPGSGNMGETKIKYKYFYKKNQLTSDEITYFGLKDSLGGYFGSEITSLFENANVVYLHPPRTKTLMKLEKAPFPEIYFNSNPLIR